MNKELISKYNEEINDEMDKMKSCVIDGTKKIEILKTKLLQEINNGK